MHTDLGGGLYDWFDSQLQQKFSIFFYGM